MASTGTGTGGKPARVIGITIIAHRQSMITATLGMITKPSRMVVGPGDLG